jgi:hypothetical protein
MAYRSGVRCAVTMMMMLALPLASCSSQVASSADASAPYPDPPDGATVTWDDWVSGFSTSYCVSCHNPNAPCGGSGCHTPSDPSLDALLFDMRDKSSWTQRAGGIRCGIAVTQEPGWFCDVPPETYPKPGNGNPFPTDQARGIVVDWIEAGCP